MLPEEKVLSAGSSALLFLCVLLPFYFLIFGGNATRRVLAAHTLTLLQISLLSFRRLETDSRQFRRSVERLVSIGVRR